MVAETILQADILMNFAYPFLLIFFILFAVLEKSKLLGEGRKQLNALIAFVVGLIFISAISPKMIMGNLILFLTVALVVVFVVLVIWGFIFGEEGMKTFEKVPKGLKWLIGIVLVVAVLIIVLQGLNINLNFIDFLFYSSWSADFWTNFAFIAVVVVALAIVLGKGKSA